MSNLIKQSLRIYLAVIGMWLGVTPARADAISEKGDQFLRQKMSTRPANGWASLIVKLEGDLTLSQRRQFAALKADIYRNLSIVRSVALRIPNRNVPVLAQLPFVHRISTDVAVERNDEFTVGRSGADIAIGQFGLTGSGVTVAVVDSGIKPHADLGGTRHSRILASVDIISQSKNPDPCGHGTHIGGIIAGDGTSSTGPGYFRTFYGIARKANLVSVRVLNNTGQGSVSSAIRGIQWVIDHKDQYGIRVLNLSLGHPVGESYQTDPLCQAVEAAWKAGIVVVCAAGNGGRENSLASPQEDNGGYGTALGSIQSPANDPFVITVGAMKSVGGSRRFDTVATYSSRGPSRLDFILKPDIVAPGNRIISLNANGSYLDKTYPDTNQVKLSEYAFHGSKTDSPKYFRLSGTSMAAPVVSGAAALLLEADPSMTPDTVKARLMISADKWGTPEGAPDLCAYGAGYLNIPAALASTAVATRAANSPVLLRNADGTVTIDEDNVTWGTNVIWGVAGIESLNVIWGSNIISGTSVIWGSRMIWSSPIWLDNVIWGTGSGKVDLSARTIFGES